MTHCIIETGLLARVEGKTTLYVRIEDATVADVRLDIFEPPRYFERLLDMFAAHGTPVIAPVAGVAEQSDSKLGGLGFRLWGDDGNFYYGAHLASFGAA